MNQSMGTYKIFEHKCRKCGAEKLVPARAGAEYPKCCYGEGPMAFVGTREVTKNEYETLMAASPAT